MVEEWRPIPGYERYEASSIGRIRRCATGNGARSGRIKVLQISMDGYLSVNLHMGTGRALRCNVNNLVCRAFHGLPPAGCDQSRHHDGKRKNNFPENLSWTNAKGNADDRRVHGTHPKGSKNGFSKLDEAMVADIKRELLAGEMGVVLARQYNVEKSTIYLIARGKTWRHVDASAP